MADTLEFTDVALPRSRCATELMEQLLSLAPSGHEPTGRPSSSATDTSSGACSRSTCTSRPRHAGEVEDVVRDYGNAIRDLAIANIFPGDMLWSNFGVTRHGRVVFYDYDEIEYLTDCMFRAVPAAPNPETELSGEAWYSVGQFDVFPEEFEPFLLGCPQVREASCATTPTSSSRSSGSAARSRWRVARSWTSRMPGGAAVQRPFRGACLITWRAPPRSVSKRALLALTLAEEPVLMADRRESARGATREAAVRDRSETRSGPSLRRRRLPSCP